MHAVLNAADEKFQGMVGYLLHVMADRILSKVFVKLISQPGRSASPGQEVAAG